MQSTWLPDGFTVIEPKEHYDAALLGTIEDKTCYDEDEVMKVLHHLNPEWDFDMVLEWYEFNIARLPGVCFLTRHYE